MSNLLPTKNKNRLKELRKDTGMTQERIAEKLGVTVKTYRSWENCEDIKGIGIRNISDLVDLANLFNVSVDYLLNKSEFRTPENDFIGKETGLSDNSIDTLKIINNRWGAIEKDTLNFIMNDSDQILDFLSWLSLYTKNDYDTPITYSEEKHSYEKCGYVVNGENGIIFGKEVLDNSGNPGWNQIGVDILESHAMLQMQEIMIEWKNKRKSK